MTTDEPTTVVRAFELPVHRVEPIDGKDGWALLRECWRHGTDLANWAVQQLLLASPVRLPGETQSPKPPTVDLYALAFGRAAPKKRRRDSKNQEPLPAVAAQYPTGFFAGACVSASTILNETRAKYNDEFRAVWLRQRQAAFYRYPRPWPVHAQGWKDAGYDKAGKPFVVVALPGGLVKLTLRGGPEFGRQLALFRETVAEFAAARKEKRAPRVKQVVIRQQPASPGCHRPTVQDGGRAARVMVKMVADVPVREKPGDRTLVLLTDPAAFWVAELDGRPAWVLNADHVRRGVVRHAEHLRTLQRLSEDGKAERRLTGNRHRKVQARLEALSEKDRRRLASWTHETAAHLVGYAVRQRVGEVLYLDRDRGFCSKFPWYTLHSKLAAKCKVAGIAFYSESVLRLSGADPLEGYDAETEVDIAPNPEDDKWQRISRLREQATGKLVAAAKREASHPAVSAPCATSRT